MIPNSPPNEGNAQGWESSHSGPGRGQVLAGGDGPEGRSLLPDHDGKGDRPLAAERTVPTKPRRRTAGSLTHADFGAQVEVPGMGRGLLWSVHHVAAIGDIPEPWTRITIRREQGHSEASRGLPPGALA